MTSAWVQCLDDVRDDDSDSLGHKMAPAAPDITSLFKAGSRGKAERVSFIYPFY